VCVPRTMCLLHSKQNMSYRVSLTRRAERDLALLVRTIRAEHSANALAWYAGLKEAILSLQELPDRCPPTPEHSNLRHLLYGSKPHVHRVIYRVVERRRTVEVIHIRHGAQQPLKRVDIP
jgi:toxin ParE1/3/4